MKILSRTEALIFLFLTLFAFETSAKVLIITEVQIAGEKASDDFIRIYNPNDADIYLGNYQNNYFRLVKRTKTSDKDYTIKSWSKDPEAKVPAFGFYLWANKDYSQAVEADIFTSQTISANNGIALRLGPENTGLIVDAVGWGDFNNVLFQGSTFPENPTSGQKLERKNLNGIYQDTSNNIQDFFLTQDPEAIINQKDIVEAADEKLKTEELIELEKITLPTNYPTGIILNELLPSPKGPDATEEWIEIFNQNSFEVDISGWKISDTSGKITTYVFPQETKMPGLGFLILSRPTTKIVLNNDGDGLNLILPNGNIIDSVSFQKAPRGQSFNRGASGEWFWSSNLSPGSKNISPIIEKTMKDEEFVDFGEKTEEKKKEQLAAVSQQLPKSSNSLFVFLIALAAAAFSGSMILILKNKISGNNL